MEKQSKFLVTFITGIFITIMLAALYNPGGAAAQHQRVLTLGKIGPDVRQLQMDLDKKGYNLEPFDGVYGLRTHQAVIDLQKKNNLKPTGIFDKDTAGALREKRKAKPVKKEEVAVKTETAAVVQKADAGKRKTEIVPSRGLSRDEFMTLARVVHGEARGESFEGQVAVAAVVLNRARSGHFPDTVSGVVFQRGAFDAVRDGQIWLDPDEKAIKAAELAMSGYDPTGNAIYYWNPVTSTSKWIWTRNIHKQIGDHVFAR